MTREGVLINLQFKAWQRLIRQQLAHTEVIVLINGWAANLLTQSGGFLGANARTLSNSAVMVFRRFGKSRQSDYRYRGPRCYGNEYTRVDLISTCKFKMYVLEWEAQVHSVVCLEYGYANMSSGTADKRKKQREGHVHKADIKNSTFNSSLS